ncbi:listeriolysin S biosynthesis protein LlsD [Listeria monocytogenes]|nr:streptolysin associated protein SagD [Listeria monocytogenes]EIA3595125.1 listeriolysin S biosynthesis protein LlsD [Listeria monocytogenes]EII0396583.1 listeriolysin S biosynthesis protein LlsD [Listeria monocytogenes]EIO8243697.1 listeriolysin S biosynthesis protein LlsD [Listeria monocytogenes]EIS4450320.1 listeriolysin S biosynthesis protein LlsD [Listeria monocytogenes]
MISIQNNLEYNKLRWETLSGNVTGIWENNKFFLGSSSYPIMKYHYITANFVNFEKHISENMPKISYHLSGYGVNFNEALVSFIGESAERYTYSLLPTIIKDRIIFRSYEEMTKGYKTDLICELKYINSYYSSEVYENYVTPNDTIQWIAMNSLIHSDKKVWMPLQFVTMYTEEMFSNEKRYVTSAVSTGTACHETVEKSIENALIEYLQIDSFNLWWYGGFRARDLEIDITRNISSWFDNQVSVKKFLSKFNVHFSDISFDKSIYIVLCEIEAKNSSDAFPKYTVGVQGGYSLDKSIYRAFMECLTVLEYNMNVTWTDKEKFLSVTQETRVIDNLDDNVIYYSKYGKPELQYNANQLKNDTEKVTNLKALLEKLPTISQYAAFLPITPSEFRYMNCEISRVILPELLSIHLPSYPPYYHIRYEEIGGVVNNIPHPIA